MCAIFSIHVALFAICARVVSCTHPPSCYCMIYFALVIGLPVWLACVEDWRMDSLFLPLAVRRSVKLDIVMHASLCSQLQNEVSVPSCMSNRLECVSVVHACLCSQFAYRMFPSNVVMWMCIAYRMCPSNVVVRLCVCLWVCMSVHAYCRSPSQRFATRRFNSSSRQTQISNATASPNDDSSRLLGGKRNLFFSVCFDVYHLVLNGER